MSPLCKGFLDCAIMEHIPLTTTQSFTAFGFFLFLVVLISGTYILIKKQQI